MPSTFVRRALSLFCVGGTTLVSHRLVARRIIMRSFIVASVTLLMLVAQAEMAFSVSPPCSCLQELWVDYPGPYDLYFSLDHLDSCDGEGEEGLWYGIPSNSALPQIC